MPPLPPPTAIILICDVIGSKTLMGLSPTA